MKEQKRQHEIRNAVMKLQLPIRYLHLIQQKYPCEFDICEDMKKIIRENLKRILDAV